MTDHELSSVSIWHVIAVVIVIFGGSGRWMDLLLAGGLLFLLPASWRFGYLLLLIVYWLLRTLKQRSTPLLSESKPVPSIPASALDGSGPIKADAISTQPLDQQPVIQSAIIEPVAPAKPSGSAYQSSAMPVSLIPSRSAVTDVQQTRHEPFVTIRLGSREPTHRLPPPEPSIPNEARLGWIPPGESVKVAGFVLPGGMLYVWRAANRFSREEPSMIDPSLEVTSHPIDLILKLTSYWPDYATLHPDARRAYLQWLAGDRREKEIDIGYLFLFYYGLERRALIDAKEDSDAQADIPSIAREIRRLLAIHESNDSFRNYATAFLDYLESATIEPEIYVQTLPKARRSHPLPLRLRIALGQLAVDRQPLPAEWALVWVLSDPNRLLRTPVKRCVEAFATLFKVKYSELFGTGMRLRANQTRLTISYRAASGKLNGMEFKRQLNHLPEISAQSAPQAKLQEVIDLCATLLEPYSRFIARHPERDKSHEALLLLPSACWPDALTSEFLALQEQSRHEMRVMRFDGLMERLRCSPPLTREMLSALASAFSINRIGMAPDFEEGRKRFKPDEWVVLYPVEDEDHTPWNTPIYQGCVTTVELACLVALADDIERLAVPTLTRLTDQIDSWAHLLPGQRQRLKAHMRLSLAQPPRLTTLKKRLQPMTLDARHAVAKFLAHLAEADGIITPGEVKQLERIYQALQLDVQMLYADLHGVSAQRLDNKSVHRTHATGVKCADSGITHEMAPSPGKPRDAHPAAGVEADASRVRLDFARIDQLQQETESVTTLLAQLFAGETAEAHPAAEPTRKAEPESVEPPLFGLSSEHVAFLRHLVMRPTWSRQELSDLAADMDLMLDGTLELLNDVIIGLFEMDLYEGEDPVEILQHQPLLEKLSA